MLAHPVLRGVGSRMLRQWVQNVAAAELDIGGEDMEQRIRTLQQLLPDIMPRMAQVQPIPKIAGITSTLRWMNQQVPFCIRFIEGYGCSHVWLHFTSLAAYG